MGEVESDEAKSQIRKHFHQLYYDLIPCDNPYAKGGQSMTKLTQQLAKAKVELKQIVQAMHEWKPKQTEMQLNWKRELDCDKVRVIKNYEATRPVAAKKVSQANITKKRQKQRVREELKARMSNKLTAVGKAVLQMFATEADDGEGNDDDGGEYAGLDMDKHEKDDFLRSDNSVLTEYSPVPSEKEEQYASDPESPAEEESDESEDKDEEESEGDNNSGSEVDERPHSEVLLQLPQHPLHLDNKGGERRRQDETMRTWAMSVLEGLVKIGKKCIAGIGREEQVQASYYG